MSEEEVVDGDIVDRVPSAAPCTPHEVEDDDTDDDEPTAPPRVAGADPVMPPKWRNVYIAHLPIGWSDQHLCDIMSQFGTLSSCRMFNDSETVRATGLAYGFALFDDGDAAERAVKELSGMVVEKNRITIKLSKKGAVKKHRSRAKRDKRDQHAPQPTPTEIDPQLASASASPRAGGPPIAAHPTSSQSTETLVPPAPPLLPSPHHVSPGPSSMFVPQNLSYSNSPALVVQSVLTPPP